MRRIIGVISLLLFSGSICFGYNVYLYVDGVQGECIEANHLNWIDATSYQHGISRDAGSVDKGVIIVGKELDKATPILNQYLCAGTSVSEVKIEVTDDVYGNVLYRLTLSDVQIVGADCAGDGSGSVPSETVSFECLSIEWRYQAYDGTGTPSGAPVVGTYTFE